MPELLNVSQFFARGDELLGKEVALKGYAVIHKDNPDFIYLVEGVQTEGEIFDRKIQLKTIEESLKKRSFEEYWDDLVRDGKTDIPTKLALSHYHVVLGEKSYQSLEFFIQTKAMDFLDEFSNEYSRTREKSWKLRQLAGYSKRHHVEDYDVFTHKIVVTGFLTETLRSEKSAVFTWTNAKLYRERFILYICKTLSEIAMPIEKVTKLAEIQDSSIIDFGHLRLEAILAGHYSQESKQLLYLLPHMLYIHVDTSKPRGVRIDSEAFYENTLPPMRGSRFTHANPIHLIGRIKKLDNSPYSHEISDIQEVAVLDKTGIWHIPIEAWRYKF
jgi:hypothetical protein